MRFIETSLYLLMDRLVNDTAQGIFLFRTSDNARSIFLFRISGNFNVKSRALENYSMRANDSRNIAEL